MSEDPKVVNISEWRREYAGLSVREAREQLDITEKRLAEIYSERDELEGRAFEYRLLLASHDGGNSDMLFEEIMRLYGFYIQKTNTEFQKKRLKFLAEIYQRNIPGDEVVDGILAEIDAGGSA